VLISATIGGTFYSCSRSEPASELAPQVSERSQALVIAIHNCAELQAMENDLSGDYQLANDIDCAGFDPEGNGKGFRPVGIGGWIYTPFEGHFDGAGHVIENLTINRPLEDSVGLFGLAGAATIERVGLEDVSIVGYEAVGALLGATEGTLVREVYATGSISGHLAGSVVGFLKHEGILRDSYSRLTVDWEWQGGLLCDYLYYDAQLEHSYSVGTGDEGRLYGDIGEGGEVVNSFFDCTVAGDCGNEGGQTTANLKSQTFLAGQGWDFTNTWAMSTVDGYPCLRWQPGCGTSCNPTGPDTDCDGVDDDCDGTADDDYASQSSNCGTGACARTGTVSCVSGSVQDSCIPGPPAGSDATCNGSDEDCNGSNDEDFVSQPTSCGTGPCARTGITACVSGSVQDSCTPGTPASSDATCNATDEDCNGSNDEDYVSQSTSCGVGACAASGTTTCVAGSVVDSCTPAAPGANDATCNGIDDDCNGISDEDYVPAPSSCGVGACTSQGTISCVGGVVVDSCVPGTPGSTDGCGGGDEDCDGYVDEDCCVPTTCAGQQANCGSVSDGCGGTLDCGTCSAPETCGGGGASNVCGVANLPPPASEVAPPITGDVPPTAYEAVSYLFTGTTPIQHAVQAGAIAPHSIVAVRGRVLTVQQAPLPGVRVSVMGHPELGFTYSRNDGTYDYAFNGGVATVLEYTRPGYLPVQRTLQEDWQTQAVVDDVVLTQLAPISATINPNLSTVQTVQGPEVSDDSGLRRPVLLVPPGTSPIADVNGQSLPLDSLTLRISEYTVGSTGPKAMPAALPPASAYTYAVEFSVDEVGPTAGVRFARPLPYYLDNFVDFPVGAAMPMAFYDRAAGVWVPEEDGVVLRIHSITGGSANLSIDDADPNPTSDTVLSQLGIEPWERERLAALYPVGKTLWRVAIKHFSPCDINVNGSLFVRPPDAPKPPAVVQRPTCDDQVAGSIINCQGRVLMEQIPLGDTGLTLQYQSDRTPGGVHHLNEIEIPLPQPEPETARQMRLEISVGRRLVQQLDLPIGTPSYRYVWDGLDADGRPWPGPIEITVRIVFDWNIPYIQTPRAATLSSGGSNRSFGAPIGCPGGCDCVGGGGGAVMPTASPRLVGAAWWAFSARRHTIGGHTPTAYRLGGWDFTSHHHYSPLARKLYLGTGSTRSLDDEVQGIVPFAGMGTNQPVGDEVENNSAFRADLGILRSIAASPDGTVYFQMDGANVLWLVTPDGKLRRMNLPSFLASSKLLTVDPQGRPYLARNLTLGRLELTSEGPVWTRLAGAPHAGDPDYSGQSMPEWSEGSLVRNVSFRGFFDAAVGSDGITYLVAQVPNPGNPSEPSRNVVLRIGADGHGSEIFAMRYYDVARSIELDARQRLIIADQQTNQILRVQPNGILDVVAGGGTLTSVEPHMALASRLGTFGDLSLANNGDIYFINDSRLRVIDADGEISQVCWNDVPGSPSFFSGQAQTCGVPTNVTSLPDGRVIVAERNERRLLAINARTGGWPIHDPSETPTSTYTTENRCVSWEEGVCTQETVVHHYYEVRYLQYRIPSEDGSEIYHFDERGQHRMTTDARSGRTIVAFNYSAGGQILGVSVPDTAGFVRIDRDFGLMTFVPTIGRSVVASGAEYLTRVEAPNRPGWAMSYDGDGLMTSFWDRRGNREGNQAGAPYRFTWETVRPPGVSQEAAGIAMLRTHTDPTNAVQTFSTDPGQAGYEPIHGATWCGTPVVTGWDFVGQATTVTRDTPESRRTTYQTRALRAYRDPADPATRYVERTAVVTEPSGARVERTDRRRDGTARASGPGWSSTSAETHQRTNSLPTETKSATTTLDALTSDGSAPSQPRPALTQTHTRTRTRAPGPPTEPSRFTESETFVQSSGSLPTRTSSRVYDSATSTTTTTSAANRSAAFVEDALGRLTEIRAPGQVPTLLHYDTDGNLAEVIRQKGSTLRVTSFGDYVARNRPRSITSRVNSAQSTSITLGYSGEFVTSVGVTGATPTSLVPNESLLPVAIMPPSRPAHGLGYDARGLAVSYAPPSHSSTEDPAQCPSGVQCVSYNRDRQVSSIQLTDGTSLVYTYGGATNDGLLHGLTVPGSGSTSFVYDTAGRLASATAPDGAAVGLTYQASLPVRSRWSGTHTVTDGSTTVWTGTLDGDVKAFYNGLLELDTLQVVGGYHARFGRDLDGLMTGVTNAAGGATVPALSIVRSPLDGSVTSTAVGSVTTTQQFDVSASAPGYGDLMGLGASVGATALFATAYEHDDLGRITQLTETVQGTTRVRRYQYDTAGRLTHVRDGQDVVQAEYQYDANGNRTQVTIDGETELVRCPDGRATNDLDQLCDHGGTSYVYDARGALSQTESVEGTTTFTYDGLGLLKKVILPEGDVIHYVHDAMGRRIGKLLNGQLVKGWLYADGLRPLAQLNAAGQIEATYVYGSRANVPDLIVENNGSSPVTYRVVADHLGTPRLVVRVSDGVVVHRLDVDEFGRVVNESGVRQDLHPFGFAAGLRDRDTGLVRFGARDYDAYTGRWMARDPILFDGGDTNLYAYVENDPINMLDPLGTDAWSAAGAFLEGAAWTAVGGVALSAALAAGTIAGGVVAVGMIGYGAFSFASSLGALITGSDLSGNQLSAEDRIDVAAGMAGGMCMGGALGVGASRGYSFTAGPYEHGGGGINLLSNGKRIGAADWHSFDLTKGGKTVNRPHLHFGGTKNQMKKHWPWQTKGGGGLRMPWD
jgi:RHS repeat-associated protein